jgi:hypothetical protein
MYLYRVQGAANLSDDWSELAVISVRGHKEYLEITSKAVLYFAGLGWKKVRVLNEKDRVQSEFSVVVPI